MDFGDIKGVFCELQGEGAKAGRVAVFVRFSGCNHWSGLAQHGHSGYPDCRPECLRAYEAMANLATKAAVGGSRLAGAKPG